MSAAKPGKVPALDRWNLRPAPPGVLRGRVRNLRSSESVGRYGQLLVVDFDLFMGEDQGIVPVRMVGTDFQGRVMEEEMIDVPDPDPSLRPVTPWRVTSSHSPDNEIIAHYPGREFLMKSQGTSRTVLLLLGMLAAVAALTGVLGWRFDWFH